jgi:Ala-tRNA(Pro) deacylase
MKAMGPFEKVKEFLDEKKVHYEYKEHEEVRTSEEAAKARGEDIKIGAKAMILKCDDKFVMCILSAALKIDNKKLKVIMNSKNLRFATPDEVMEKTGCLPGGVPPFGNVFGIDILLDKSILANEHMAFNAGERTKSLKILTKEYLDAVKPRIEDFSC